MTRKMGFLVLTAALMTAGPLAASAQQPQHGAARAAPAGRAAPAARPAAPHMAAPHIAPRMAAPHIATPRFAPATSFATPHSVPQRLAIPHNQPATINRSAQQNQLRQRRVESRVQTRSAPQGQSVQLSTRQQLRAERAIHRSEDRELRRLPASQRAQRREEIRNARQQRALGRQQLVQPNALQTQPNAQASRANRRNGDARVTADAARQGRFALRAAGWWHKRT